MIRKILIFFLFNIISNKVPEFVEIKKDKKISFNLEDINSTFYAYLTWEEDYELDYIFNIED